MIYCIWYPSGGFGHFINAIISTHGKNFHRPPKNLEFSSLGDSHAVPLIIPKYRSAKPFVMPQLDPTFNYTALIDNGINDESTDFSKKFTDSKTIKICYDDWSWPIVAATHIIKAMRSDLETQIPVTQDLWSDKSAWAQREKFFLYLRDHPLRHAWRPSSWCSSLQLANLCQYDQFYAALNSLGIDISPFQQDWQQWFKANNNYIEPVITARHLIDTMRYHKQDLGHIKNIWTQAVVYYYLWLEYGREVPHNDYADFFASTGDICRWLET